MVLRFSGDGLTIARQVEASGKRPSLGKAREVFVPSSEALEEVHMQPPVTSEPLLNARQIGPRHTTILNYNTEANQ
jgi:hypothetical protein